MQRKLIEEEGGSLSTKDAARQSGMSEVALLRCYKNRRLIAWREKGQRVLRVPAWQFRDGRVLAGLERVLSILDGGARLDGYGRLLFFLSKSSFLGGKRPLDCLRKGEIEKAIQAAGGYCQQ